MVGKAVICQWFLELTFAKKRSSPRKWQWKNVPGNGLISREPFHLRLLWCFERCEGFSKRIVLKYCSGFMCLCRFPLRNRKCLTDYQLLVKKNYIFYIKKNALLLETDDPRAFFHDLFLSKSKSSRRHNQYFVYVPLNITHEKKANENSMISKTKK